MKLVDLSTNICAGMPKPPSAPEVTMKYVIEQSASVEAQKGYSNKLEQFIITTHVATHFDAPSHFTTTGKNIDQYDLEYFYMIPTVVLDIPKEPYGEITVADLTAAENANGKVSEGDLVILNTGADRRYLDASYAQSPYLNEEAARYLAAKKVKMVGIDSFTVDDPRASKKPAHVVLLKEYGIMIIECVSGLDKLESHRFKTICFPLNIENGSGAFVRMVGVIEE